MLSTILAVFVKENEKLFMTFLEEFPNMEDFTPDDILDALDLSYIEAKKTNETIRELIENRKKELEYEEKMRKLAEEYSRD